MKKINKIFFAIIALILFFQFETVSAKVNVTPGGGGAPIASGCSDCSWVYSSSGLGVRLSLYKYDGKNLVFKDSIDLVNNPSSFPSSANTTKYKYGRYSYTKLNKTIDFGYYSVGAVDINNYGFSTINENSSTWSTTLAKEVQNYFGDSESDTINGIKNMFGIKVGVSELSQYYIVAEPTAFFYNRVGKFYTYATGYEYMTVLDEIDTATYKGSYAWNLWESQGRHTFLGYMFNGMYNQTDSSKKYPGFTDGRYDYYNFLAQGSTTSLVQTTSSLLSTKSEIRANNAYARSNYEYGVMIFWIGQNSTTIGGCPSTCGELTGDSLLKCAENYCSEQEDVTNKTQKEECIVNECKYTYTKLTCGTTIKNNGSDTSCGAYTSSNKKTCEIVNKAYYSYKVECNTSSTVTFPETLPATIPAGQSFEYRVRLYGNKNCTVTFDEALWKFNYASSYTNTERQNYLKAIEDYNQISLSSYLFDSSTANITVDINERKNGNVTTTNKNLVAEEKYELGDNEVRSTYTTKTITSYHNKNEIIKSVKSYITDSSNSTYYELPGVCISSVNNITVSEGTKCNNGLGPYNKYFTDIYADETTNNVTATITYNPSGLDSVKNSCYYDITEPLSCYISTNTASGQKGEILINNEDITFTLNAVTADKTKTIRYNIDTTSFKEIGDSFNNKAVYKIVKNSINGSKNITVYGTITDGTNRATCKKEITISPQTCKWDIKTDNATGKTTIALKTVSDRNARYYMKDSTSNTWLEGNTGRVISADTTIKLEGKIVTSSGTYYCEYYNRDENKYCTSLYKPAEYQKIKDYCIAHWEEDGANYSSYNDCYTSCTDGDVITCKKKFVCTDITSIRQYCKTSYQDDGYETIGTCINECSCQQNGLDYYYRTINLNDPFPQRDAHANWLGFEEYITDDNEDLTPSTSGSPEYEIVLDSKRINAIQADTARYNSTTGNDAYGDYVRETETETGAYKSKFIHYDDVKDGGFTSYFTYIEGIKTS